MNFKEYYRADYCPKTYKGVDNDDEINIQNALANGEKLMIDKYGHIYDTNGRYIADGMRRGSSL